APDLRGPVPERLRRCGRAGGAPSRRRGVELRRGGTARRAAAPSAGRARPTEVGAGALAVPGRGAGRAGVELSAHPAGPRGAGLRGSVEHLAGSTRWDGSRGGGARSWARPISGGAVVGLPATELAGCAR